MITRPCVDHPADHWQIPEKIEDEGRASWVETNPMKMGELTTAANKEFLRSADDPASGVYVPMVKLIRQIRRTWVDDQPGDYYFEVLTYRAGEALQQPRLSRRSSAGFQRRLPRDVCRYERIASRNLGRAAPDRRRAKISVINHLLASMWDSPPSTPNALAICSGSGSSTGQKPAPVSLAALARDVGPTIIALCPARTLARTTGAIDPKCPANGVDENRIRIYNPTIPAATRDRTAARLNTAAREAHHLHPPQLTSPAKGRCQVAAGRRAEAAERWPGCDTIPVDWP